MSVRFGVVLVALFLVGVSFAQSDDAAERLQRIQELQAEIIVLTAEAEALENTLHHFVEQATADGELTEQEMTRLEELTAQAEELAAELDEKISELEGLRGDIAEEGKPFHSLAELIQLLSEAYSFVYVSAERIDDRFALFLQNLHRSLLGKRLSPRFAVVEYANNYYPLVPGVAVLVSEGGWPLRPPPPFMPAVFLERYDVDTRNPLWTREVLNHYTPFPIVSVVTGEVPNPPILFFDRIHFEREVKYINIPVTVAGQKITIPIPWRIQPKMEYRIYVVSSPLINEGTFDPESSTYSYLEGKQEIRNKVLGPFMDALYRSPPYGP